MDWKSRDAKVGIKFSKESGRRSFFLKADRRGGGSAGNQFENDGYIRTTRAEIRTLYPNLRLPRSAGASNLEVHIKNQTDGTIYAGFYEKNNSGQLRILRKVTEVPANNNSFKVIEGPLFKYTRKQYLVVSTSPTFKSITPLNDIPVDQVMNLGFNTRWRRHFLVTGSDEQSLRISPASRD